MLHVYLPADLADLLIGGDATDEPGPEAVRDVVGDPESPEAGLVVGVDAVSAQREGEVPEYVRRLGKLGAVWHQGGDDHVVVVNLQGHFELLQQLDVFVFQALGYVLLVKQLGDLSHACGGREVRNRKRGSENGEREGRRSEEKGRGEGEGKTKEEGRGRRGEGRGGKVKVKEGVKYRGLTHIQT